jgi:hypothetical protein
LSATDALWTDESLNFLFTSINENILKYDDVIKGKWLVGMGAAREGGNLGKLSAANFNH